MEGIHGVDVSWLHQTHKDHSSKTAPTLKPNPVVPQDKPDQEHGVSTAKANGIHLPHSHSHLHRPHSNQSIAQPKDTPTQSISQSPLQASPKNTRESKLASTGRRNSWMSSLSSKFSSSSNALPASQSPENVSKGPKSPQIEQSNPFNTASIPKDIKKAESPSSTPPGSPKPSHTFLQSALRRLSSSGNTTLGKGVVPGNGGLIPRKTMNVDPYRERCALPELDQNKLRRVSFCVDVEIAGSAQYVDDVPEEPKPGPSLDVEPGLTRAGKELDSKKSREKKIKMGEGEALKHPEALTEEKEIEGVIKATGEDVTDPSDKSPEFKAPTFDESNGSTKEPTKKKEKKKRTESERKERKERKQREALANGMIPAEIKSDGSGESGTGADTPPRSQDRPTTDPLRIYRRCCQLRETPVLKKIAEQLASPSACPVATPGILHILDLSGYWMQLPDVVTLGDYLAIVPVKKLILDNCGLGDEAVRVLLAGLLAAKTSEQAKFNRKLVKKPKVSEKNVLEKLGVIEKVSLKNNPKIGKEGWRHIATFMYMSRSLKAIDLSMIPFPDSLARSNSAKSTQSAETSPPQTDMLTVLQEAIGGRLGGSHLEELVMAECNLSTDCIGQIIDAVIKCGTTRLGLAGNNITKEGMEHIIRYVQSGHCMGLDIGSNDIHEYLDTFADALNPESTLWAISLANCNLSPLSLEKLLPALAPLSNFRFIDLSHNRDLFATKPSALKLFQKFLPRMSALKRLHLMDVAMTPEHAIAIADTLPECRELAHLNILENDQISALASAKTEAEQEEACALYASLMAAVRVSQTIICIDIDVPGPESSEIVKALAKQVVAYSLHNLERLPIETSDSTIAELKEPHGGEQGLTYPDVLLHLIGHTEEVPENHDQDPPAPDDDYIVGGTGVVKALDICLNRAERGRQDSRDLTPSQSGMGTPKTALQEGEIAKGKAKEMSKNLLGSARKIRARLQLALINEAKSGNEISFRRLQFLDNTLRGMIQRFEEEYPETRLTPATDPIISSSFSKAPSGIDPVPEKADSEVSSQNGSGTGAVPDADENEDEEELGLRSGPLSRRPSSPNLASYQAQAQEEGRMHRIGQRIRRDILRPQTQDYHHGTTGLEGPEPEHLAELRRRLEGYKGEEIREQYERLGPEGMIKALQRDAGLGSDEQGHGKQKEFEKWVLENGESDESMRAIIEAAAGMKLKGESEGDKASGQDHDHNQKINAS